MHQAIRFYCLLCVDDEIENITKKQKHFKHYDVNKAFYKLMFNAQNNKTIINVTRRIYIRLLIDRI